MESYIYLCNDIVERVSYTEDAIVRYVPKNIRMCKMVRKDKEGKHRPFVVIDFYDFQGNPVSSVPFFGEHFINLIRPYINNNSSLPETFFNPKIFQYITVKLNRPAYRLFNHSDILNNICSIDHIYEPVMGKDGSYVMDNTITFLMRCTIDNETGDIRKLEDVQSAFNSYFSYCYEFHLGEKRRQYEEMIKLY